MQKHWEKQKAYSESCYASGSRSHAISQVPLVRHVVSWRLKETVRKMLLTAEGRISVESSILVLCSGEGLEGSILADLGFLDVTVSDVAENAVKAANERDPRLKVRVINVERNELHDGSYDVVIVQDGLHHLSSPVTGFLEMLRICRVGCAFLEPHDSLVGRLLGTKWEKNGESVNYVFRWDKKLVNKLICSFVGSDNFTNASFSYWHHNVWYAKVGRVFGGEKLAIQIIKLIRNTLGILLPGAGNQFSGIIIKP
ncbi:MAG: class I SAM-dependent methyltransferase [Desulfuromonadales bacterium]